jgi:hypothetical protein
MYNGLKVSEYSWPIAKQGTIFFSHRERRKHGRNSGRVVTVIDLERDSSQLC